MRTKNAKRLWPVPATLTVVALAAFLAFGLMATTDAQPVAAQDADCTITIEAALVNELATGALSIAVFDEDDQPADATAQDLACNAVGDTATIKFVGPAGNPVEEDDIELYLLVEDKSGNLSFYANTDVWQAADEIVTVPDSSPAVDFVRKKGKFFTDATGITEAKPTKYFERNIMVPRAKRSGGRFASQSTELTVQGEGRIHVYLPQAYVTNLVRDFANEDCEPDNCNPEGDSPTSPPKAVKFVTEQQPGTNANGGDSGTINITFLGVPALGEDSDNDRNKILDDWEQCVTTTADGAFDATTTDPDGNKAHCGEQGSADTRNVADTEESRSKLVVIGGADGTKPLIDGKSLTYEMDDDDDTVTIHAVLDDAEGNPLEDLEVSFSSTTNPSGIVAARDLADEKDTEIIGVSNIGEDVAETDAVASYTLTGLAKLKGLYTITVEVMVGNLNLGTVTVTRPGTPETLVAGVFNAACLIPDDGDDDLDDDDDLSNNFVDLERKGCDASGMASRFGAGEMIVVKAHLEDSIGNVVGESDDLDSELANEDDDLLGDADMVTIETPVDGKGMPRAWVYTVDEDATLGDHTITVSTDATDKDDDAIASVMLIVSVAGPPISLAVSGDSNIALNGYVTYTVTATDIENGIPYFIREGMDQNDMVTVSVQPTDALVVGTNTAGQVMLDDDGEATFIVYAALDAEDGDQGRLIARLGELQDIEPITFGLVLGMPGMPMDVMAMADGHDTINVSWETPTDTGYSDITGYMVQRGYMDADNMMMMWMDVDPAHMGMDMMYMDMGLMAETPYYYRVAAMNAQGMGAYSDGMAMAMTMAEDMAPDGEMLTSPSGVDAASFGGTGVVSVSWTPGQNATQHWVVLFSLPGYDAEGRVEVQNDPDANFQVFRNVPVGEYEVIVASYDPDMGFQYQDGIGMVTVE